MNIIKILVAAICLSAGCVQAADVTMAFGDRIPPFCFPETNTGIEVEIMREALAYKGHTLKPKYYSYVRIPLAFKTGQVDAATTDLGEDMTRFGGYYGNPAVIFDNFFFTLKERKLVITKPDDIKNLSVISFQGAAQRYPDWLDAVVKAGHYHEEDNQALQVLTLDKGRYDIVLADRNIFEYFTLQLRKTKGFVPKPTEEHPFVKLNPMDYRPVFRDETVRNDFNAGLAHLKETGRYQAIYDKYLKE